MYIQTEKTPNPNSLKFLPGKIVSNSGSFEVTKKDNENNNLIRNLLSVNGVEGVFLAKDFISRFRSYGYSTVLPNRIRCNRASYTR